jgi:hypothetical protein
VKLGILVVVFSGPLTAVLLMALFRRTIPALRAARGGVTAEGRALRITTHRTDANGVRGTYRVADIEFSAADGRRVTYPQVLETGVECRTGEAVTVRYDPANPKDSATIKSSYDVTTNLMVLGGLTVLFGFAFVYGLLLVLGVVHTQSTATPPYPG